MSDSSFRNLFHLSPTSSCVYDFNTFEIILVNIEATSMFGFKEKEFLSLNFTELFKSEEYPRLIAAHENIKSKDENILNGVFSGRNKSGNETKIEIQGRKIDFEGKACILAVFKAIPNIDDVSAEAIEMVGSSLDVFCTFNEQGEFIYVNDAVKDHWGYSPDELIGTRFQQLIHEDDVKKTIEIFEEIIRGKQIKTFQNRYRKKSGEIAHNLWSARPDKKSGKIYAVARDCREKIEQEKQIIQSEKRFRALVQEGTDMIGILDKDRNFFYTTPAGSKILGINPDSLLGKSPLTFIHPEDQPRVKEDLNKILDNEKVFIEPFRFLNDQKEYRWLETTLTNMLENPIIKGIVANSKDVTDQINERNRLKLLESVITHANDAILITEAKLQSKSGPKIIYVNEAFTEMTGYEAHEVIGKTPQILHGPKTDKKEISRLDQTLKNWERCEVTTINYKKNGEEFWVNFTVTPVADESGNYTHLVAIERDVTKQKTEEFKNELRAQISADFNIKNNFATASKKLCKSILEFGNFDGVELWTSDIENTQMKLYSYALSDPKDIVFYDYNPKLNALEISEGMPGTAWSKEKIVLWDSTEIIENSIRLESAKKIGVKAVLGVPLIHNKKIVGVLIVASKNNSNHLKNHLTLFQRLQIFIGSELNRKKLENDLTYLFDSIPDIICLLDSNGKFLKINKAGCNLLGCKEKDILQSNFDKFVAPNEKGILEQNLNQIKKDESKLNFESRYLNKNGDPLWLSWYCNVDHKHGLIYATAKDITEEKKLRELNEQSNRLAKIGSWELDTSNDRVYWSDQLHQLHGTDPNSFQPTFDNSIDFYREDFRQMVRTDVEKCINSGEPFDFEAIIITTNKKEVWVRVIGRAEFTDGKCTRIYGSTQNINTLKEAEHKLVSFAENLPGLIYQYTIHPDGTDSLNYVLGDIDKFWGFSINDVKQNANIAWAQVKAGGDLEKVQASIQKSIETKSKWSCRMRYLMPTGELRKHLGFGTPYFHADGTISFNSIVLDITKEAKNEELLEQTAKMARIGSWEVNLIEQTVYWSDEVHNLHGTDPKLFTPDLESAIEFYREDFREMVSTSIDKAIKEGSNWDFEAVIITTEKQELWVHATGSGEFVNGKCVRLFGGFQDIHERKKSEIEVLKAKELAEENEQKMKEAQKLARIGSWYYDVVNQVSQWSEETYNIWGLNKDITSIDLIDHQKLIHPKDWDRFNSVINNAIEKGIPYKMDLELVRPDGSYKTVNTIGDPIFDENGQVIAFKGTTQDISDRIIIENELRSAKEKAEKSLKALEYYKFSLDQSAIVAFTDKKGVITSVNDNFCEISKYPREEIIGNTHGLINSKYHPKEFFIDLWKTISSGKVWRGEIKNQAKDGSYYWVDTTIVPFLDDKNKPFQYLAIRFDITLRKEAAIELEKANERFEKVTEATNDAIWDWDVKNGIFYSSAAIEKFFGKTASKSLKESDFWKDSFHPQDVERVAQSVKNAIEDSNRKRWKEEYRIFNNKGEILHVIDQGIIIREKDGKAIRMVGAMTDISDRKKMELELKDLNVSLKKHTLELERSNEELEQFAFIASHDLQEPLRMISSFMNQLKRKYNDQLDEKAQQYIHFATDGARRMKQIILDLLEYSRASRLEEGKEDVDLNKILSSFKQLRSELIKEKSATIESDKLPIIHTYNSAITQIIHCIVENAIKYSKEGVPPIIKISVSENKTEWKFNIVDNGIGIDSRFFDKIFILFQRLHNKDEYSGTGIGLSVAKKHVEFLGGELWLESSLGKGSNFYFTIPKNDI